MDVSGTGPESDRPHAPTSARGVQGRVTAAKFYSLGQFQWQTSTAYPGAGQTDVTPPAGGTATSTFTNALGQTTASWQYTTAAPDGNSAHADVSSYTYTPGGQTATVTDNAGNTWSYACDLLGDKISATGPDTGSISYAYDNDGELTSSTDACGQVLTYTYDNLNRKTSEYSGTTSGTLLAKWAYDAATLLGGASTVIPAAEGKLAGTYTITYTSLIGLLQSTAYTADGGLPAETVGYSYDPQGGLAQSGGNTAYLDDVIYSPEGQAQRTTFGLYGKQLVQTYTSDPATTRLLTATTSLQTLGSAADTVSYTYSQDGSITSAPPRLPGPTSKVRESFSQALAGSGWRADRSSGPCAPAHALAPGLPRPVGNDPPGGPRLWQPVPTWHETYAGTELELVRQDPQHAWR